MAAVCKLSGENYDRHEPKEISGLEYEICYKKGAHSQVSVFNEMLDSISSAEHILTNLMGEKNVQCFLALVTRVTLDIVHA